MFKVDYKSPRLIIWNLLKADQNGTKTMMTILLSKAASCRPFYANGSFLYLLKTLENLWLYSNYMKWVNVVTLLLTLEHNWPWRWHCFSGLPIGNYMFKANNRNAITRCEICSKLTINTPKRRQWHRFTVFIVNVEHISHLVLVFLSLTLSR